MAKPKRIDLNYYTKVDTVKDLDGKYGIILRLQDLPDGTKLPETYWLKKQDDNYFFVENVDDAVWHKEVRISNSGTRDEYAKRVQWWVDEAFNDEEYREIVWATFNVYGYDIEKATKVAVAKLINIPPNQYSKRKTYLKKHLWDWWTKGVNWARKREERNNTTNDL